VALWRMDFLVYTEIHRSFRAYQFGGDVKITVAAWHRVIGAHESSVLRSPL
jgi:hypothetical protein